MKLIQTIICVFIAANCVMFSLPVYAVELSSDVQVGTGDAYDEITLISNGGVSPVMTMTDGAINRLLLEDESQLLQSGGDIKEIKAHFDNHVVLYNDAVCEQVTMIGTSDLVMRGGDVDLAILRDGSVFAFRDGKVDTFVAWNAATIFMTGGEIKQEKKWNGPVASKLYNDSRFFMVDGRLDVLQVCHDALFEMTGGYAHLIDVDGNDKSVVNIRGGKIDLLGGHMGETRMNVYGGEIDQLHLGGPAHFYGYDMQVSSSRIIGKWADGTPFNITFVDIGGTNTAGQIVLHEIPEPGSLLIIALAGCVLVRRGNGRVFILKQ